MIIKSTTRFLGIFPLSSNVSRKLIALPELLRATTKSSENAAQFAKFLRRTRGNVTRFSRRKVLVGITGIPSHHVGLSQSVPVFAGQHRATLVSYRSRLRHERGAGLVLSKILGQLSKLNTGSPTAIYRAFGVRNEITPRANSRIRDHARRDLVGLQSSVASLEDLERAEVRGTRIGDLIYDQHLLETKLISPDLKDPRLWAVAEQALVILCFFEEYFDRHKVVGVFGSNAYYQGIPIRIGLARGIPVFEVSLNIMRVKPPNEPRYTSQFSEEFKRIERKSVLKELDLARQYLDDFVSGLPVQPLFGHTFASFVANDTSRTLEKSTKPTVLVAPHNAFTDSPHALGFCLFPDYGEWLKFLGELSTETDFRWLVKAHPDRRDPDVFNANREWIKSFARAHPKFEFVPEDTPHGELISAGINAVLTVSGSIAFEYAACGIPVINACPSNPHAGYNFTLSPKSREEYAEAVKRVPMEGTNIDSNEVVEFFFMRMIESRKNPFIDNLDEVSRELGGAFNFESDRIYEVFVRQSYKAKRERAKCSLLAFFESPDLWWYERHGYHC